VAADAASARSSIGSPTNAATARVPSLTGMMSGLQALRSSQSGGNLAKATPESSGDPALFRTALMGQGQSWDSVLATKDGRADAFLARLPLFSYEGGAKGNNTLVLRGEYFEIKGSDRIWAAVNVGIPPLQGPNGGAVDPAVALRSDVLVQCGFRVDPAKAAGTGGGAAKYKWVQAARMGGKWDSQNTKIKNLNPPNWPFTPGKPFFIRVILDPRGAFSYVDGKFFGYTRYPSSQVPKEGDNLVVQLPIAGDAGEKPTWKVTGMWWGVARVEPSVLAEVAASLSTGPQIRTEYVPDEIRITGLRPETEVSDLLEAFRRYNPVDVRMEGSGAATIKVSDPAIVGALVADTDRKISVLGALLNVARSQRTVTLAPLGGGGGGGGGVPTTAATAATSGSGGVPSFSPYGSAGTPP
jgi:hypothetical protein